LKNKICFIVLTYFKYIYISILTINYTIIHYSTSCDMKSLIVYKTHAKAYIVLYLYYYNGLIITSATKNNNRWALFLASIHFTIYLEVL